jgi:hypothetical protein
MSDAFGDARVIPASRLAKERMNHLKAKGIFQELGDVWRLGAALGISLGQTLSDETEMDTFQNINSLDPEGILAAVMMGLYPNSEPKERLSLLVAYAEWGINEIYHKDEIGTLDFAKIGLVGESIST